MQKKSTHPEKKAQKALQPIKKSEPQKKSTMVLLKALTMIPVCSQIQSLWVLGTSLNSFILVLAIQGPSMMCPL